APGPARFARDSQHRCRRRRLAHRRPRRSRKRLMFTGIVEAVGRISAVDPRPEGVRIAVNAGIFALQDVAPGDSIALNGCCLTVIGIEADTMHFDVSAETLRCTAGLDAIGAVNMEKALRLV